MDADRICADRTSVVARVRTFFRVILGGMALAAAFGTLSATAVAAEYATPNFVVRTSDPVLAKRFGDAAEASRREMAELWLGHTLPNWSKPCPVKVTVGERLGAGGEASFSFDRGEVFGWTMDIQGTADEVVDSVLPHEITHMVLASHFRRPLPRWADEGAASAIEHASEREKLNTSLVKYLQTNRGIPFSSMFVATKYPDDIRPFYAQSHSLVTWLIDRGGHRKYISFLESAIPTGDWAGSLKQHYGVESVKSLQETWNAWVAVGMPLSDGTILAKNAPNVGRDLTGGVSLASVSSNTAPGGAVPASHTQGGASGRVISTSLASTSGFTTDTTPLTAVSPQQLHEMARPRPEPNLVWTGPLPEAVAMASAKSDVAATNTASATGWESSDRDHQSLVREYLLRR